MRDIAAFQLGAHTGGIALGLAAVKFWTRSVFKGANALKRKINPTRVPIEEKASLRWLLNLQHAIALLGEPGRCIHVGDRESDIYELFCAARDAGSHFLIRSCANRRAGGGTTRLESEMDEVRSRSGDTCCVSPDSAAISPAHVIPCRAVSSCDAVFPASMTSPSVTCYTAEVLRFWSV